MNRGGDGTEPYMVQWETPTSTLAELERFTALMRAAGAAGSSVVGADFKPSDRRRHSGDITRLWGYPRAERVLAGAGRGGGRVMGDYRPYHRRHCPARAAAVAWDDCSCPPGQFGPGAVPVPLADWERVHAP